MNVYQRMLAITDEAGRLEKEGKAPGAVGGYAYHRIDDVEDALRPLLVKHGVLTEICTRRVKMQVMPARDGKPQMVVEAWLDVTFVNADDPEDTATSSSYGVGIDYQDKAPGKAVSYALKSLYLAVFHMKGSPDEGSPARIDNERETVSLPETDVPF